MLGVAAGAVFGAGPSAAEGIQSRLGIQLFTVRDLLQKDVEGTLAALAALGYAELEMFGLGGNACHLKDFAPDLPLPPELPAAPIPNMRRMVAPGDGTVDFVKVLAEMDRQRIEHGFVECDMPADAMEVARRGIRYLKSLRYRA